MVTVETQVVSGRERKVYTLTPLGERAYSVAARAWAEVACYILEAVKAQSSEICATGSTGKQEVGEERQVAL